MSAVSDSKHVVLIHGTWFNGDVFGDARREFEARGYTVHTPTLRYHDLPRDDGADRRYYRLTARGVEAARVRRAEWRRFAAGVEGVLRYA